MSAHGITVKGHAGYAPQGQDIVCAGVSALIQTVVRSMEQLTKDPISYTLAKGNTKIVYENLSERGRVLAEVFLIGAGLISTAYPEHVKVKGGISSDDIERLV